MIADNTSEQIAKLEAEIEYFWNLMNYWKDNYSKLKKELQQVKKVKKKFIDRYLERDGKKTCRECNEPLNGRLHFTNRNGHWSYEFRNGSLTDGIKIDIPITSQKEGNQECEDFIHED